MSKRPALSSLLTLVLFAPLALLFLGLCTVQATSLSLCLPFSSSLSSHVQAFRCLVSIRHVLLFHSASAPSPFLSFSPFLRLPFLWYKEHIDTQSRVDGKAGMKRRLTLSRTSCLSVLRGQILDSLIFLLSLGEHSLFRHHFIPLLLLSSSFAHSRFLFFLLL